MVWRENEYGIGALKVMDIDEDFLQFDKNAERYIKNLSRLNLFADTQLQIRIDTLIRF